MQDYQEEYLANLRRFDALSQRCRPEGLGCEEYTARLLDRRAEILRLSRRNMELLRAGLFPLLDDLFRADERLVQELEDFSFQLYDGRQELDVGLFCQIHHALLSVASHRGDRNAMIRELYWVGMGRHALCNKLVGLPLEDVGVYHTRMRMYFTEAAAYLKYFDQIEDPETRGYIIRSRANIALGQFRSPSERIQLIGQTLQILQDEDYRAMAPDLPWDRYLFMTHQHMASSISYDKGTAMTAEDTAAIMESVYIVHRRHLQEAEALQRPMSDRWAFPYHAIEYYCGIHDLDHLLNEMERMMDRALPTDFSADGVYSMISLPAFYCQFLRQWPDRLPPRADYLDSLYEKILAYVDAYPAAPDSGALLFQFLRKLAHTYVETTNGLPYGEFLIKLLLRCAPQIYVHSQAVGTAAQALCGLILDEEPGYFDDVPFLRDISDPAEKRREALGFAMGCGVFHDVGKINFLELYAQTVRQWFEEEYEAARLHTTAGASMLFARPSTCRYAVAAYGHHAWYDGSHGYPEGYRRLDCFSRQMVDVIGLVDWLENAVHSARTYTGTKMSFDQAVHTAVELEGKRFSPLLTARLRDPRTAKQIQQAFDQGRTAAFRRMYEEGGGTDSAIPQ